jgi:two-component system nitrate/nitrite response regulator NarL
VSRAVEDLGRYVVHLPVGPSLFGTLEIALLENLGNCEVTVCEGENRNLRDSDVLIERPATARRLVVLGAAPTRSIIAEHLNDGVWSLVGIDASRPELLAAIASLDDGPAFVSSSIVQALAAVVDRSNALDRLSARERDVLAELMTGKSNREIAEGLFVSTNTVRAHLQSISAKLGISSRAKLAAFARARDLA